MLNTVAKDVQALSAALGTRSDSRISEKLLLQEAKQERAGVGVNKKPPLRRREAGCSHEGR